ncbi:GntR family transcriptional regulator [Acinetobacter vivianii]
MELAPGAVVDEVSLSEEFGLSRSPVRELLRQMAAEGYLELEANRATRVSSMNHQSLRNFFLAAPLIYISTTQLAAINATQIEIDQLKQIQKLFREAIDQGDIEGRVYYNNQFHLEIGKIAHNPYLLPSLERLLIDHARLGKIFIAIQLLMICRKTCHWLYYSTIKLLKQLNVITLEKQGKLYGYTWIYLAVV